MASQIPVGRSNQLSYKRLVVNWAICYYTLDDFDIADPSGMQDACHIST